MREAVSSSEIYQAARQFWLSQLTGLQHCASLLLPNAGAGYGNEKCFEIPFEPELAKRVLTLSHQDDKLLYVILVSAATVLLNKYTSSSDLVIAGPTVPGANREHVFGDWVLFRCRLPNAASVRTLLELNRKQVVEVYQNQHYPLTRIFASPGFEGLRGFAPQILLALNTIHQTSGSRTNHQIRFEVEREGLNLRLVVRFDSNSHDPALVRNVGDHFVAICGALSGDPNEAIVDIDILRPTERETLLNTWNTTTTLLQSQLTLHQCFEAMARAHADVVAVVHGTASVTYAVLESRATRLAHKVHRALKQSRCSNHLVGIYASPSTELIVAILAVLKAGAAYVPISKDQPDLRIRKILVDAEIDVVLVDEDLGKGVLFTGRIISVVPSATALNEESELLPKPNVDDLAYVIYTSGSTGAPKGVMVEHRGVVNSTLWRNRACALGPNDVMLNLFTYGFDGFNSLLLSSVLSGGRIVIPESQERLDLVELAQLIERHSITIIALIPILYEILLDTASPSQLISLRLVVLAAERSSAALIAKSMNTLPHVQLINEYGPTENSVVSLAHLNMKADQPSVVGRPISNTQAYILGEDLALLPIGAVGEICVSGIGLARGYLNRQDQTAEKFVTHPFRANERLYRTGDLGSYLVDGNIEFRGRSDHQVKIRGYRVELQEIERCMETLADVKRAVVSVHQDRLAAHFVPAICQSQVPVRDQLEHLLPAYMMPAQFIEVSEFPLTQAGKVDRTALLVPQSREISKGSKDPTTTEVENIVAGLWETLLGKASIGREDHFFELGGDSIRALQFLAMLRERGYEGSVHALFETPTISDFCSSVKKSRPDVPQVPVVGRVDLTPIQLWLFEQDSSFVHHFNQSVFLFRKEGFETELLRRVFIKLVEHHDALRITFRVTDDGVEQENHGVEHNAFDLDIFDFTDRPPGDAYDPIRQEVSRIQSSIDLSRGPLVKCGLFRVSSGDHLLVAIHHLVVDGYSWRILLEDFETAYAQVSRNSPIQLPPKTSSFQAWSGRLQRYARNLLGTAEVSYWERSMSALTRKASRKTDAASVLGEMPSVKWSLDVNTTQCLVRVAPEVHKTGVDALLLAALGLAWRRMTSEDGVAIWIEGHGREEIFGDVFVGRTVGWLTTQYPIWLPVPTADSELAIALTKSTLQEVPSRGVGFGALQYLTDRYNKPVGRLESPQVLFNYLGHLDIDGTGDASLRLSDLPTSPDVHPLWRSPFQLSVGVSIVAGKVEVYLQYDRTFISNSNIATFSDFFREQLVEFTTTRAPYPKQRMDTLSSSMKRQECYIRPRVGAPKVFFFPPKLSLGLSYYLLAQYLTNVELVAFDFIERPDRIDAYLDYITGMQQYGPFVLGAYSSAALVIEVARIMHERGLTVSDIILLDAKPSVSATVTDTQAVDESIEFFLKAMRPLVGAFDDNFNRATGTKIRRYSRFIQNMRNHTPLDTTFHFVKSQTTVLSDIAMCQALSTCDVRTYEGFGDHSFMLNGAAARSNAAVIQGIVAGLNCKLQHAS